MVDSILTFPGGKQNSVKVINEIMPEHGCFVDVFGGGGSILLGKDYVSKVEVYNDLNGELVNFWRVIQRHPLEFLKRGKWELYSRELFEEYKTDWESGVHGKMGDAERAFRFFYLIRQSFSSIFASGWSYGCSKSNPATFFNVFGYVEAVSSRLKNVYIDNMDFEEIVKRYDCEKAVMVVDPPYVLADVGQFYFKSYGKEQEGVARFTLYDHQRLYNCLSGMKGKFILTIDDCAWIRERYIDGQLEMGEGRKFWWIENILYYSMADADSRKHVKELIICNYDIEVVRKKNLREKKLNGSRSLMDY